MTRQEANLKIIEILHNEIIKHPDMRFIQLLMNLNVLMFYDEFYLESEKLLNRMKKSME